MPGPASYLQNLRDSQWENLQKEEDERRRKLKKEGAEEKKKKTAKANPKNDDSGGITSEGQGDKQAANSGEQAKGESNSTESEPAEPSGEKNAAKPTPERG